jgi:hypothetical protein
MKIEKKTIKQFQSIVFKISHIKGSAYSAKITKRTKKANNKVYLNYLLKMVKAS